MFRLMVIAVFFIVTFSGGEADKIDCIKCRGATPEECDQNQETVQCNKCLWYDGWYSQSRQKTYYRGCSKGPCDKYQEWLLGIEDQDNFCGTCSEDNCNNKAFPDIPDRLPTKNK